MFLKSRDCLVFACFNRDRRSTGTCAQPFWTGGEFGGCEGHSSLCGLAEEEDVGPLCTIAVLNFERDLRRSSRKSTKCGAWLRRKVTDMTVIETASQPGPIARRTNRSEKSEKPGCTPSVPHL